MPTVRLNDKQWEKLEQGAVDLTIIRRKPVQVAEIVRFILDNYAKDGVKDMIATEKAKK
jgi:hypothetical protein